MSNELALTEVMTLGKALAESNYFSDAKKASQAVVKVLAGQELGIGPIASMSAIYIIQGTVTLSANVMASLIKSSSKYNYKIQDHSDLVCIIEFFENNEPIGVSEFAMDDAKQAGLQNKDNWKTHPKNMLFARAMSNGAKWFCPDLFNGQTVYTSDEFETPTDFIVETPTEAETTTPRLSSGDDRGRELRIDEIFNHDEYPIDGAPKEQVDFINARLEAEGLEFRAVTIPELMELDG